MDLSDILLRAQEGRIPSDAQLRWLGDPEPDRLPELFDLARTLKTQHFDHTVQFCAIINAKSGRCSEDCAFCAQSARYETGSPEYPLLDRGTILAAARVMRDAGARRFSLVTSGKQPSAMELQAIAGLLVPLRDLGLAPDISVGILGRANLDMLREAGLAGLHHNLETSRTFFPSICTTHDYEEDVQAVRDAVAAGLMVCSGGVLGLGESWEDRIELALTLRGLGVHSVPLNFLHPIQGTPLGERPVLDPDEALRIIALFRVLLPDRHIRICGGRETVFGPARKREVYAAGASGIMIGDYLTVKGASMVSDREELSSLDLELDRS
jgi:biotin synthase